MSLAAGSAGGYVKRPEPGETARPEARSLGAGGDGGERVADRRGPRPGQFIGLSPV